jgi:hypothetical protein
MSTTWPTLRGSFPESWIGRGLRDLGHADDSNITLKFSRFRMMLSQHGLSFNDLAEQIERSGIEGRDGLLNENGPLTVDTLTQLYRRHGARPAFLPGLLWYGDCITRLRRGQQPTAADFRKRTDVQSRVRLSMSEARE